MRKKTGFTLIELSIVLVIIGLIVGGVLVGRDLIAAAEIRAQISQIEKYNTAVNTFKVKYGGIPGDLLVTEARDFGLFASTYTPYLGFGDGNGSVTSHSTNGMPYFRGETVIFWRHLSEANLIDGSYSTVTGTGSGQITTIGTMAVAPTTHQMMNAHLPEGKIGRGSSIAVGAWNNNIIGAAGSPNYFAIAGMNNMDVAGGNSSHFSGSTNIFTPQEAYRMDIKMDDGLPLSGSVVAINATPHAYPLPGRPNTPLASCVTSSVYVFSGTDFACSLQIKLK